MGHKVVSNWAFLYLKGSDIGCHDVDSNALVTIANNISCYQYISFSIWKIYVELALA